MFDIILYAIVIMLASLAGVLVIWKGLGEIIERHLGLLVSFAAGVFLAVVGFLGYEVLFHGENISEGVIWIIAGAILITVLFRFIPHFHHHHNEHHEDDSHSHIDARKIVIGDMVHNVGDGILLASAFAVNTTLGIATAISIFVHEVVQEISEFFVLRQAGLSINKALAINFCASGTILIGAIGGYFLLDTFSILEIPLLGISAGAFLVIVLHDLIPDSVRQSQKKKNYTAHIAWFIVGLAIMAGISFATAGDHQHGIDDHAHDEIVEHHDDEHINDTHSELDGHYE